MIMSVTPRRPNMPSTAMSAIPLERRVARGGVSARLASRHPADHPTVPCCPGGRELVRYGGAATPPPGGWLCGAISSQSFSSRLIYPSPPFDIMALRHRDHSDAPAIVWLRGILRELAAQ